MSQQLRRATLIACSATAVLGLAACGPDAIPGPAAGTDGLPNGTKLNAMLLPATALPPKLKLDPSGTKSTGDGFNPPISPSAVPASKACDMLNGTGWINAAGINAASFAQNDYMDDSQDMFAQELDGYRGNDAQTVMANLKAALTACHTYTVTQNGQNYTATVTMQSLPGVGDDALQAVITSPDWTGGSTLVAARVGSIVVTTYDNDQRNTGTAGVDLTKTLAKNAASAR
ncbi:hypothetical protein F7Q99_14835 [Streptomyces kaniharaensis]|uniref:Sensor domain-containing protein n=1 Tax=Streptomyces kaniharaensis TaxID=212423 RepID=A0A6N7KPQ2_9ACTN|nr:hypothetical protein [Streptomyces kaniharaensis]MQS13506.1 hypothetical protein [Streptomyces kaniharaensis]